jgi:hypothetical protein
MGDRGRFFRMATLCIGIRRWKIDYYEKLSMSISKMW